MKKIIIFLAAILITAASQAQHCSAPVNYIPPVFYPNPGIYPTSDMVPGILLGQTVNDTLYLHNYSSFSGITVDSVRIDSINNLPAGLCWTTNKYNNKFAGGADGSILISGATNANSGQYKLRIIVTAYLRTIGPVHGDLEALASLRYYLRVACPSGVTPDLDTLLGPTNDFLHYNSNCSITGSMVSATISPSNNQTICNGTSIRLTANSGIGYTYAWSTGDSSQSIVVSSSGSYVVVVTDGVDTAVSSPVLVSVVSCNGGGGYSSDPGFAPYYDLQPCVGAGQYVHDTIYFRNATTVTGIGVNSVRFDSIANLPSGWTWSTNKPSNTFAGGDTGMIFISGITRAASGQYKLRIIVTADLAAVGPIQGDLENLTSLRYYLKVACANGNCPATDTVLGKTNSYLAYNANCQITGSTLSANISVNGSSTICQGNSVTLTANSGNGYSYLWSTGQTTQSITVTNAGSYTVTVSDSTTSAISNAAYISVINCQSGHGYSASAGFAPISDLQPCITAGQYVHDTIFYRNDTAARGLNINTFTLDSINNLPAGLIWSTNKPGNVFAGGDTGMIFISGTTYAPAGQYKLKMVASLNLAPIGNINNFSVEALYARRYYLRVACANSACRDVDTVAGKTNDFIPDNVCSAFTASIYANSATGFCQGGSVTLTGNGGIGDSYLWSNNATTQSISVNTSGTYTLTITHNANTYASNPITVVVYPSPVAYFTLQPDTAPHTWSVLNQCSGSTAINYVWSWGDNSTSTGATPSHTYDSAGYYNICVFVQDNNGCSNTYCDSNAYLYKTQNQIIQLTVRQTSTGIDNIQTKTLDIKYYGNTIHFAEPLKDATAIKLYDLSGRVVMEKDKFAGSSLDVNTDLAHGVYILRVENDRYSAAAKFVIAQ
jgi:PKD repeat protein